MAETYRGRGATPAGAVIGIGDILMSAVERFPQAEIVDAAGGRFTYQQFAGRVRRLGALLRGLGIRPGDRVGWLDHNGHRYVEALFGVPLCGAVLHPVNTQRALDNLVYAINHAEDDLLVVHADFLPKLSRIWDRLEKKVRVILISEDSALRPDVPMPVIGLYEHLLAYADGSGELPPVDENRPATLLYTTGARGAIRGVSYSHRRVVAHTFGLMSTLCACDGHPGLRADDVFMPISPMFQANAWGLPYLFTFFGAKQVYCADTSPSQVLKMGRREGVTFSNCQPTWLQEMLNCPDAASADLTGWKMLVEGQALGEMLCRRALQRGIDLCSAYGMTESGPLISVARLHPRMKAWDLSRQVEKRCRTGRPAPWCPSGSWTPRERPCPTTARASAGSWSALPGWRTGMSVTNRRAGTAGRMAGSIPVTSVSSTPTAISRSRTA